MIGGNIRADAGAFVQRFKRHSIQRAERAALLATDKGAALAKDQIRSSMSGAGLGRLGNAIGSSSDLRKGGRVFRRGGDSFSASGLVFIRSKSDRTVGAIISYTEGAEITPKFSRWLWIATDEIPSRVSRYRMTPARYRSGGLESRIGPLIEIPGRNPGERLLIVRNVTTSSRRGSARRLPRRGGIRAGREVRDFIVAFVGIRRTSRAMRTDARAIVRQVQQQMPALLADAFRKA